ncbi:MAG: hypothetical protein H9533_12720 [Rhodobacteraceae bacterium]|jgi:hypothetical protein|nr:hypothetical protein [Paracoccaceae bacterium]MCZ8335171.1 hypothetical protein [Paracoccaceae bacterium]
MPRTLPIARPGIHRPVKAASLGAISLFLIVYLAILGVMFAPEGFFLSSSVPVVAAE